MHRTQEGQNDKGCVGIFLMSSDHGPRTRATSERGESFCYAEVGTNYPGVKFMQVHRGDESRCVILSRVLFIAEIGLIFFLSYRRSVFIEDEDARCHERAAI